MQKFYAVNSIQLSELPISVLNRFKESDTELSSGETPR